jgi:hypothetical protein
MGLILGGVVALAVCLQIIWSARRNPGLTPRQRRTTTAVFGVIGLGFFIGLLARLFAA